jgi:hypothetical protein
MPCAEKRIKSECPFSAGIGVRFQKEYAVCVIQNPGPFALAPSLIRSVIILVLQVSPGTWSSHGEKHVLTTKRKKHILPN